MGEPEYGVGDDGLGDAEAEAEKDSAMANQEGNDCTKNKGKDQAFLTNVSQRT